jgi:hypothetical protein
MAAVGQSFVEIGPGGALAAQRRAVTYVVSGECAFLLLISLCCAIQPSWTAVKRGLSYYGNSVTTGVPYGAGFGVSIALTAVGLASVERNSAAARRFRGAVAGLLVLMAVVPFTPYAVDAVFDWLHIGVVTALFLAGLALGAWLVIGLRDRVTLVLFLIESAAGISAFAAQLGLHDYMIPSELVFQAAVFALVLRGVHRFTHPSASPRCQIGLRAELPGVPGTYASNSAIGATCLSSHSGVR